MDMGTFREPTLVDPQDWAAAGRWLAAHGHDLTVPARPMQFAGGLGNLNYLVHLDGRPHVLRRPPAGPLPQGANDMGREFRVLSALPAFFDLAPKAPAYCNDSSVLGAPFLLIEYREGIVIRDRLPQHAEASPQSCRILTERIVEALSRLHSIDPAAAGLQGLGKPEGMVARQAANWTMRAAGAFDGTLPTGLLEVARWLQRDTPPPQRVAMLHSDYKLDNLILHPATLEPVALIDWDMGTLGDPLLDVATLLSYWAEEGDHPGMLALRQMPTHRPGFPRRAEVLDMYARRTGLRVDNFFHYRLLALFKLCIVFQQIRRRAPDPHKDQRPTATGTLVDLLVDFAAHTLATER